MPKRSSKKTVSPSGWPKSAAPPCAINEKAAYVGHEASVSKLNDEQIFYLQSRGLEKAEAAALIVRGFLEPVAKELPLEYAVELNRLIELEMEGSVG